MKIYGLVLLLCILATQAFAPSSSSSGLALRHAGTGVSPTVPSPRIHNVNSNENIRMTLYGSSSSSTDKGGNAISKEARESLLSASLLVLLDIAFRKVFQKLAISFPSSLGGCCALFATMLAVPAGKDIFKALSPGAALLAKWLPVFFVPSLITLPLVGSVGSAGEIMKILSVIVVGFCFTLLTTAGSVVGVRRLFSDSGKSDVRKNVENTVEDAKDAYIASSVQEASDSVSEVVKDMDVEGAKDALTPNNVAPKAFSDELTNGLRVLTAATGVGALVASKVKASSSLSNPLSSVFLLSATLHNFVFGVRLPKKFTKIVHPLLTCAALTWGMATLFGGLTGASFKTMLRAYKTGTMSPLSAGAGDVLLFLLGPAVVSLAISMYDRRKLMQENLKEVATAVGVSSLGGLFGTAALVRLLTIASPFLRLSLLSRNITTPLAMAIASILGANVSLAVAMVVVTGLIGANFGASILDAVGIKDPVARGLGIGAAAHGLGTAAFVNEKDAFPFAAISMALTATACTCLVSVPVIKKAVVQLALGV